MLFERLFEAVYHTSAFLTTAIALVSLLHGQAINHPQGVTRFSKRMLHGSVLSSHIESVVVLQGIPATLFAGAVLHELGHVWLIEHGVEGLPPWAEEGFCQLISYRYYTSLDTLEARYQASNLEQDTDPIYGDGFRHVRALSEQKDFQQLVERLHTTKRLSY